MAGWNAEDYHRSSSEQQRWAREMIARLRLSGGESVLDIGCGDGKVTAEIARQLPGGFALGIDNSEEMIRFARRSFPPESCPNLAFERADASALAYDRRFDPVVSFACLHWMKDHRPVLAGIARSLKPDGRFLLQFGGKGNAAQMVEVVHRAIAAPEWRSFFEGMAFP
ncbi:MAG: class I SAM-dependent methyltransferase, partial [Armatimonadetes bacterium]|nr:class I SAM-dependent methyltransferase [Armatimonadota bacterium]